MELTNKKYPLFQQIKVFDTNEIYPFSLAFGEQAGKTNFSPRSMPGVFTSVLIQPVYIWPWPASFHLQVTALRKHREWGESCCLLKHPQNTTYKTLRPVQGQCAHLRKSIVQAYILMSFACKHLIENNPQVVLFLAC